MGSHFQKWWSLFLRWTFFPAISLFFLYLALLIVTNTGGGGQSNYAATSLGINAAQTAAGSATAAAQVGIAEQSLMGIALCGLMLGGLFAANSLGIAGADIAIRYGKSASGWVTGYAGKQGKKAARAGYQKVGGEKINKALQGGRLSRIPVLGRGASLLGRGLASVSTNEKLVEAAKKNVPNDPDAIKQRLKGSMNKEDQFAHVAKLVEMGELKGDESVYGKNIKDFLDSNADAIRRFGQTKPLVVDADKAVGGNKDMRDAERELSVLPQAARAGSEAMRKLETATKKFVEGLSKADVAKMNVNSVFGKFDDKGNLKEPTEVAKALAAGFLKFAPQLTSSLMPKMKSGALGRFKDLYEKAGADEKSDVLSNPQLPQQEKNKRIADIDARLENFGKILENNVLFGGTTPPAAAAPPPANT
jgi:hypothetical protein